MMKFLLLILLGAIALWLVLKRGGKAGPGPGASVDAPADKPPPLGAMVACARCGVRFPQDEALRDEQQRNYCSPAHLAAGPQ